MDVMNWQGTKESRNLMKIVEPYQYRDRFNMPKFIINAPGDQFFLPASSQFYFKDLPGVKSLRYVQNADHSLKETDAMETLLAFYDAVLNKVPLPRYSWKFERDGSMVVETVDEPTAVKLWKATNPSARDFRVETLGRVWTSTDLVAQGDGTYLIKVEKPVNGWTAYLIEMTYASKDRPAPFKFTTGVKIVPDILPYKFKPRNRPTQAAGE